MDYYKITHPATGKVVNLYSTDSNAAVKNGTRLLLYNQLDNDDQKWLLDYVNDSVLLRLARDPTKVMNRRSDNNNAIVWEYKEASETMRDSLIDTETDGGNMRIKLVSLNLYLTKNADDNYLYWTSKINSNRQYFKLEKVGSDTSSGTGGGLGPYGKYVYPTYCKKLSDDFRLKATDTERQHLGIDIRDKHADHGVYAFADGVVSFVQDANHPDSGTDMWTMGNCIAINHSNPTTNMSGQYARTLYMHLLSAPTLTPGQQVKKGDRIGTIGNTGKSTGPHLHFGLFVGDNAQMAPGVKGWTKISTLPVVNPINALPFYHVDMS